MRIDINIILSLLRYELLNIDIPIELKNKITPDILPGVYELSKKHDITPIISNSLFKNGFLTDSDFCHLFQNEQFKAVLVYENQNYELERIKKLFEENDIPFIPLKGSVIRAYYPEAYMRTSCDIDILIKEENLEKASDLLINELGYKSDKKRSTHDINFYSNTGVHLELHFDLNESDFRIFKSLEKPWVYAHPKNNGFEFVLENEFFVFYHLVHMAKHFVIGGCGIKPFIDLLLLKEANFYDNKKLTKLCKAHHLNKFRSSIFTLLDTWFYGKKCPDNLSILEDYIIMGGVYGSFSNRISVKQSQSGGKFSFIFKRIFPTLSDIRRNFNKQDINVFQYPYYAVKRILHLFNNDKRKSISNEIKTSNAISKNSLKLTKKMLDDIGL